MKKFVLLILGLCAAAGFGHETLTTTVLFDREIVRILEKHCVMCHAENGSAFSLETYEHTWLKKREVRAAVIARRMPPWAAVPGYGQFVNDNSLTLRETQFVVSWVEGLGPRNSGTVFTNVAGPDAARPPDVRAHVHFGEWELGTPQLTRKLPANTIGAGAPDQIKRTAVDLELPSERRLSALEYLPGDRRVVRAAFFTIQESGQWIGSWTPWQGFMQLPNNAAWRLPAGSHLVAEIHYRGTKAPIVDQGTLGLYFTDQPSSLASDLVLNARAEPAPGSAPQKLHAAMRLTADTYAFALLPEVSPGLHSIEVAAKKPDGTTDVLLFAKDFPLDWPAPYIFKNPVALSKGTELSVTAYRTSGPPTLRLIVSSYGQGPTRKASSKR
ncbi:MAG: hypothetical protein C5B51_06515 [Terriglobia bacterium]|nr:MAG: hypothetical protein C5B51_06515 [Terriglobia bacterium]